MIRPYRKTFYHLLRVEKLAVGASPDLVNHGRFKVDKDSSAIFKSYILEINFTANLGTCLPVPVSEKKVEKESSWGLEASKVGRVPSG